MLYRITNRGPACTITFLGAFEEDETRQFNQGEIDQYVAMNGVPFAASLNQQQFEVEYLSEDGEGKN
jgi:hypothetical protein